QRHSRRLWHYRPLSLAAKKTETTVKSEPPLFVVVLISVSKKLESFRESSAHWRGNPPDLRLNLSILGLKSWEIATPGKRTGSQ
ncbi:MAG: hypothetical protein MR883_00270, partial [Clostridiales bacterium]|nr:hypothetical protein [Clostridiales bacterium]